MELIRRDFHCEDTGKYFKLPTGGHILNMSCHGAS